MWASARNLLLRGRSPLTSRLVWTAGQALATERDAPSDSNTHAPLAAAPADNVACDAVACVSNQDCIRRFFYPAGTSFSGCIKCDEVNCGADFIRCAGANRRSSGVSSVLTLRGRASRFAPSAIGRCRRHRRRRFASSRGQSGALVGGVCQCFYCLRLYLDLIYPVQPHRGVESGEPERTRDGGTRGEEAASLSQTLRHCRRHCALAVPVALQVQRSQRTSLRIDIV